MGVFFCADANGDGKLSAEEVQTARENLFNQRPLLRFVFERASDQTGENIAAGATKHPLWKLTTFLDTNNDGELSSAELRQAVASAVQTLYLTADANRDSQLDPAEINRAVLEVGRSAAQAAFNASDADRNGAISQEEFDKAIMVPAHVAFRILDANRDKQLSADELRSAADILIREIRALRVPEAPNSLSNQIGSADNAGVAPVAPARNPIRAYGAGVSGADDRVNQRERTALTSRRDRVSSEPD